MTLRLILPLLFWALGLSQAAAQPAAFAGLAIENSMLGAAHAAANPVTAHYGVVHGAAVGVMLPHVIRFNAADSAARLAYAQLASAPEIACVREGKLDGAAVLVP